MQNSLKMQNRCRGVVLNSEGLQKFQKARSQSEFNENFGKRYTLEEISRLTCLDILTIRKVLNCKKGVDKRTLEYLFNGFNIHLHENDYLNSSPNVRQDWGEAICVSEFYGREEEISILEKWLLKEQCRLIAILGIGGIGKTSLSIKFVQQISDKCDYIIWRSLKDAPSLNTLLSNILQSLVNIQNNEIDCSRTVNEQISILINCFREHRCLLILDNVETLLCSGSRAGQYLARYEEYGEFFKRLGESNHQSCLLITAREKPKEIALMEEKNAPVRVFHLNGLAESESNEILKRKGLKGSESEFNSLCEWYAGNALVLKIVASTIKDLFNGCISSFLKHKLTVFGDIRDLLEQHFERLSDIEKDIMYWLAINREPVSISELDGDLVSSISNLNLVEMLESLRRRFLSEQSNACFTLQPILMDYVTDRLIEKICEEVINQELSLFHNYALIKATAKDHVRQTQVRLILQPVTNKLIIAFKGKCCLEKQLFQMLTDLRDNSLNIGYAGGNIINLLSCLGTDLRGHNFSYLTICQADLRNVNLQGANFHSANVEKSFFSEYFSAIL